MDLPLICDWPNRPKQKVCYETGKPAQTEYEVVEYAADNTARVVLKPITGRSHQLRVHMLALGHPILGDRFYASPEARAMAPRLLLHAEMLTITHPAYGNSMTFKAPADFLIVTLAQFGRRIRRSRRIRQLCADCLMRRGPRLIRPTV